MFNLALFAAIVVAFILLVVSIIVPAVQPMLHALPL
jgi:hypothetical protein